MDQPREEMATAQPTMDSPTVQEGEITLDGQEGEGRSSNGQDDIDDSMNIPKKTKSMYDLTVKKKTPERLDTEKLEKQERQQGGTPMTVIVIKWISMIVMLVLFLGSLLVSKLSIIHLASHLHELETYRNVGRHDSVGSNSTGKTQPTVYGVEGVFLMIIITTSLPAGVTFIRCVWTGLFHSDRAWPSLWALSWVRIHKCINKWFPRPTRKCKYRKIDILLLYNYMFTTSGRERK